MRTSTAAWTSSLSWFGSQGLSTRCDKCHCQIRELHVQKNAARCMQCAIVHRQSAACSLQAKQHHAAASTQSEDFCPAAGFNLMLTCGMNGMRPCLSATSRQATDTASLHGAAKVRDCAWGQGCSRDNLGHRAQPAGCSSEADCLEHLAHCEVLRLPGHGEEALLQQRWHGPQGGLARLCCMTSAQHRHNGWDATSVHAC